MLLLGTCTAGLVYPELSGQDKHVQWRLHHLKRLEQLRKELS